MSSTTKSLVNRARRLAAKARTKQDFANALELLKRAAIAGSAEAHYAIGTWYLFGRVLPKDLKKAARHLKIAAADGDASAMFDLALLYETGRGVSKNAARAYQLYVRAAQKGDADATKSVIRCLYHGIGAPRNKLASELVEDLFEGNIPAQKRGLRLRT